MLSTPNFFLLCLSIISVPIFMAYGIILTHEVFGQTPTKLPVEGLRQVPQDYYTVVLPPAGVQTSQNSIMGIEINSLLQTLGGVLGGGGLGATISKILGKKTEQEVKQTKQTTQELAKNQVKVTEVVEGTLNQVYDTMPEKGNEIVNKPVIKQDNVKAMKDDALKTVAKA